MPCAVALYETSPPYRRRCPLSCAARCACVRALPVLLKPCLPRDIAALWVPPPGLRVHPRPRGGRRCAFRRGALARAHVPARRLPRCTLPWTGSTPPPSGWSHSQPSWLWSAGEMRSAAGACWARSQTASSLARSSTPSTSRGPRTRARPTQACHPATHRCAHLAATEGDAVAGRVRAQLLRRGSGHTDSRRD